MTIVGKRLGAGFARTNSNRLVPYRMLAPDKTADNLRIIAAESIRWRATVQRFQELAYQGRLDHAVARRAQFAEEVLAVSGEMTRIGACCVLLTETQEGRLAGVMTYSLTPPRESSINLLAIDPEHLVGSPGAEQLRGVGTAMVAAMSRALLVQGVDTVYLHPFDREAAQFWGHRGFMPCGAGQRMCVRGRREVEKLIDGCEEWPECGDTRFVVCGLSAHTEHVRLPALRAPR